MDITVLEMLTNETGHMAAAFEKLGQFYDVCRDFKMKSVNFTPGKLLTTYSPCNLQFYILSCNIWFLKNKKLWTKNVEAQY